MDTNAIIKKIKYVESLIAKKQSRRHLDGYNTGKLHQKQMEFHQCPRRNRWVFGGNRSGKTECGAVEAVWWARGIHPFRKNRDNVFGWVVSLSRQVQRDVAQSKILHYLNPDWIADVVMSDGKKGSCEYGVIDHIIVKNVFGGHSKIGFKSCDQGREKFQGTSLDYVWFDEEPPEDIYTECRMRLLDKEGEMWGTMTPLKGLTFVYDLIYLNKNNDKNVWSTFMEWADNPYLLAGEVEELAKNMSADELESRRYGRFKFYNGLVYGEFDENVNVIEPFDLPPHWQDMISIDPGLNNPLSAHWYAVDGDGAVYVVAEHYQAGKDIQYHCGCIKDICRRLNWKTDYRGRISCLMDCAANQRTLNGLKSVSELFLEQDIAVNTRVNKEIFSGISRVKKYLKPIGMPPKLYIFKSCVNLIREFKSYFWGDDDTPKKKDDHALDELRYYLASKPEPSRAINVKSAIQRDKERLYKNLAKKNL